MMFLLLYFLNIDIDSYDLEVLVTILENSYKPDIVSIEINEKIPPPIYFKVTYDENISGKETIFMAVP